MLKISVELAQALIDYLKKRPFEEVFQILPPVLQLEAVETALPALEGEVVSE